MGAKIAKPNPPEHNEAKGNAEAVTQGLEDAADNFLQTIRLGSASARSLGYKLTDQRLTAQQVRLVAQTQKDAPHPAIAQGADAIFGGDWRAVTKLFLNSAAVFFGGTAPGPSEEAVNDSFAVSKLIFENHNIVQYSLFIKRTNCTSLGTLLKNSQSTLMTVVCKGNVDFEGVDPQTIISTYMASEEFNERANIKCFFGELGQELRLAGHLLCLKKELDQERAGVIPIDRNDSYDGNQGRHAITDRDDDSRKGSDDEN